MGLEMTWARPESLENYPSPKTYIYIYKSKASNKLKGHPELQVCFSVKPQERKRDENSNRRKREREKKKKAMAASDETPSAKRWLPLEANPDVMNQVMQLISFIFSSIIWCSSDYALFVSG